MGVNTSQKELEFLDIRPACHHESEAVYNLKIEVFGTTYLPFTVFQAPQSIHYINELIKSAQQLKPRIFVIHQANNILGYYHATHFNDQYFLDYIGVLPSDQGHGLGRLLLNHFEQNGKDFGCHRLVLDVFESNSKVRDWYLSLGYQIHSSSFCVRLNLKDAGNLTANCLLKFAADDYAAACSEEKLRGFSKMACSCGQGEIQLGLIAGHTCRLLGFTGIELHEAVGAIADGFYRERKFLIILSLPELLPDFAYLNVEKSLRLYKVI